MENRQGPWDSRLGWQVFGAVALLSGCAADPEHARRALEAQGLRDIQLGRYPWFQCGDSDSFNMAFTARSADGKPVEGAVCCGWLKSCTVRIK